MTAVRRNGVRMFTIKGGDLNGKEIAEIFLTELPKMKRFLMRNNSPFIAKVTKGSVKSVYDTNSLWRHDVVGDFRIVGDIL